IPHPRWRGFRGKPCPASMAIGEGEPGKLIGISGGRLCRLESKGRLADGLQFFVLLRKRVEMTGYMPAWLFGGMRRRSRRFCASGWEAIKEGAAVWWRSPNDRNWL